MKFLCNLWILHRLVYIIILLMADTITNSGLSPISGFHLQTRRNAARGTPNQNLEHNFFNNYFNSIANKSRELEEVIYSDIINNLRSLGRRPKNETTQLRTSEGEGVDQVNRVELFEDKEVNCEKEGDRGNGTDSQKVVKNLRAFENNDFLNGVNDVIKMSDGNMFMFGNVTSRDLDGSNTNEYLLGYSGNPFGNQKAISEIIKLNVEELSENEPFERAVNDMRKKRSVLHLYNMVLCATGCNPFSYKGYGCYCGFLGSGFVVDGIDSCCKMHDWCYNSAGCPMFLEYFIPYLWKCYHHQPLCAIDHGYYGGPGSCAQRLCECDKQLAMCLRRYPCPSSKALCTSSPWRLLQNIFML